MLRPQLTSDAQGSLEPSSTGPKTCRSCQQKAGCQAGEVMPTPSKWPGTERLPFGPVGSLDPEGEAKGLERSIRFFPSQLDFSTLRIHPKLGLSCQCLNSNAASAKRNAPSPGCLVWVFLKLGTGPVEWQRFSFWCPIKYQGPPFEEAPNVFLLSKATSRLFGLCSQWERRLSPLSCFRKQGSAGLVGSQSISERGPAHPQQTASSRVQNPTNQF